MVPVDRHQVEGAIVLCISDGGKTFPPDVFPDIAAERRNELLGREDLSAIATAFNAYAICFPDGKVTLVDTGCGALFGPSGGAFAAGLAQEGIAPGDVDRIIFTHLHGDHCGGAMHDGALVYQKASVVMHQAEAAHWYGKKSPGGALLRTLGGNITQVQDGDRLDELIQVWALPGHTPGHMGLRIGEELVLIGDVVHSEALQLPVPEHQTIYDVAPADALTSRRAALGLVADAGLVWSGSHMLGPQKFARLVRNGDGFRREPRSYTIQGSG